uniref:Uncharacterized protein n=1 Tax=Acrobeloides nanus TaxID=290746 RepID=A0A914E7E4_9BILA
MNLSSLESIRKAVKEFLSKNWPLHALILNAGIFAPADKATTDGFEMTFGTNHLGHFYLTYLLLDKLRESAPSRVVLVSSRFHNYTEISPSMPIEEKLSCLVQPPDTTASTYKTYAYSKLCNVLFAFTLHELENKNGINTYVLHPGSMIGTRIWRNWGLFGTIANFLLKPFVKSLQQGAATTVYCAASPHVENESSQYYEDCWTSEKSLCVDLAHDKVLQNALWDKSIEFVTNFENKRQY